jgi:hypothetical protein
MNIENHNNQNPIGETEKCQRRRLFPIEEKIRI